MASMHLSVYNSTNTISGTFIGDHLNIFHLPLNNSWSFELLQEMYFYAATWNVTDISQNLANTVNYTNIDEILIEKGIQITIFMKVFEQKLRNYLGFELDLDKNTKVLPELELFDMESMSTSWILNLNLTEQKERRIHFNKTVHNFAAPRFCGGATVQIFVNLIICINLHNFNSTVVWERLNRRVRQQRSIYLCSANDYLRQFVGNKWRVRIFLFLNLFFTKKIFNIIINIVFCMSDV